MGKKSPLKPFESSRNEESRLKNPSRRSLLKGVLLGAGALAAGSIVAKKAADKFSKDSLTSARSGFSKDESSMTEALKKREYVLMDSSEKKGMVRFFEENYRKKGES